MGPLQSLLVSRSLSVLTSVAATALAVGLCCLWAVSGADGAPRPLDDTLSRKACWTPPAPRGAAVKKTKIFGAVRKMSSILTCSQGKLVGPSQPPEVKKQKKNYFWCSAEDVEYFSAAIFPGY